MNADRDTFPSLRAETPSRGDRPKVPWLRFLLRGLFVVLTLLLAGALALAVVAWRKSHTPLRVAQPTNEPVDLRAYAEGRLHFPGDEWRAADPAALGWSVAGLERAHAYARDLDTSSLMIVHRGVPVGIWGDVEKRENSQSIRKSLLSSLFGLLVADGRLELDATLEELGIGDHPPLTPQERSAEVRHLLLSRSGIFHSALYEVGSWKRNKPERGSHLPGETWYYNNWDFNALATVFEKAAGLPLDLAFEAWVAEPVGMEDFRPSDVVYIERDHPAERAMGNESDHPAYPFMISARDLARFGLLYLADGRWDGRQVLPPGWVEESTRGAFRPTGQGELEYGYMWWRYPPTGERPWEMIVARGGRGHRLMLLPALDLVVVHRIPTGGVGLGAQLFRRFVWHAAVDDAELGELMHRILAALPQDASPSTTTSASMPSAAPPSDGPPASPPSPS